MPQTFQQWSAVRHKSKNDGCHILGGQSSGKWNVHNFVCLPKTHGQFVSIHNKYCMCHFRLSAKRPSQLPPAHSAENMAPAQNMLMINPAFQVQCVQWGYPQIIHLNRIVHYKPSILETPILGNLHVALRTKMGNMHETMDSSQRVQVNSLKTILGQPLESSTWKLRRWMGEGTSSNIRMN